MSVTTYLSPVELKPPYTAEEAMQAYKLDAPATAAALRLREFIAMAMAAEQEVSEHGLVYEANDVFAYLKNKLAGKHPETPLTVKH